MQALKSVRSARAAFPVMCRATPVHGSPELTRLSFVPPLPAIPGHYALTMTSCATGTMHATLEQLGRERGVTISHRQYQMPRALYPRDNQEHEALWYVGAWREYVSPPRARSRTRRRAA